MANFSDRLKELRKAKGVTQRQVAELLGVTERNYQRYEYDLVDPAASTVSKLADYFGVTTDYLLGRVNHTLDADNNINANVPPDILGRVNYTLDVDGNINIKVPIDILNLDTVELKKKLGQEQSQTFSKYVTNSDG